jgi:uncharacterized membrane-anchored protein
MNKKLVAALCAAIAFQLLVLTGMYVSAALPLWTGTEIKIKTIPVDPRSMFRGNYARLRYEISQLDTELFPDSSELRNGEVVFVTLKQGDKELYEYAAVTLDKPDSGIFLRGRIENRHYEEKVKYFRIKYGIEAFFAAKEKALQLESDLRAGGIAVLMVSRGGKARLKDVVGD